MPAPAGRRRLLAIKLQCHWTIRSTGKPIPHSSLPRQAGHGDLFPNGGIAERASSARPGSPHSVQPKRFTPTRVGTTARPGSQLGLSAVHPHACGDDMVNTCAPSSSAGSPPRVWGRRSNLSIKKLGMRFTPTRVGTTPISLPRRGVIPVHPHACGDDASKKAVGK